MGKKLTGRTKGDEPAELPMRLFAPGMSAIHRAGLGGLACTLRYIETRHENGSLAADELPGDWSNGPPWEVTPDAITLRFGEPGAAREYLKRLYALGFTLSDDPMIHLPGQHRTPPSPGVRADLQLGLTLTFLQHGKTRTLAKPPPTVATHETDGDGPPVTVEYRACTGYRHQNGWEDLTNPKTGRLVTTPVGIEGPLNPGAMVRHNAFIADTQARDPVERLLPLHFAPVGCLALAVNRGVGVLVVPEVDDLEAFAVARPYLTPAQAREGQVSGGADAALRMQVRLKLNKLKLVGSTALTFRPTAWASQQKSRVHALYVPALGGRDLAVYDLALHHLPPRFVTRTVKESVGKGKARQTTERQESFRTDSVVRPLIAENLASGRHWYAGFANLMTKTNPATDKPFRDAVRFEQRGLHAMVSDPNAWAGEECERLVVQAVHQAMRQRFRQIAEENEGRPRARKNRSERFCEKLRLDLAGARSESRVRFALTDLFSRGRGGKDPVLREGWQRVLHVLLEDWQLARDLGLLALASYPVPAPAVVSKLETDEATNDTPKGDATP